MNRIVLLPLALLALLACPRPARAEESEAERLFREARAQMLVGDFEHACANLARSQTLDPHVGTLLNLAACHERQGKVASAWVEYQKAFTAAHAEGQGERERLAQERIRALSERVPWLSVAVSAGERAPSVTLDDAVLAPVTWGKEMPVDPGPHVVRAKGVGTRDFERKIELHEGEHAKVDVPVETVAERDAPGTPLVVDAPQSAGEVPANPVQHARSRWAFEAGLLLGAVSVSTDSARLKNANDAYTIGVEDRRSLARDPTLSCATVRCTVGLASQEGVAAGIHLFGGYAVTPVTTVGLRLVAAVHSNDGTLVAFGPAVSIQATRSWSVGGWGLVGTASAGAKYGAIKAASPYEVAYNGSGSVEASTEPGVGLGASVAWRAIELPTGALVFSVMPFFLAGTNGTAWTLPLTVAYQF
jgi:hypothetical protein